MHPPQHQDLFTLRVSADDFVDGFRSISAEFLITLNFSDCNYGENQLQMERRIVSASKYNVMGSMYNYEFLF